MTSLTDARLYTFVDTGYLHGREPETVARQLLDGGADLIQLRAKDWPVAKVRQVAERLLPLTEAAGAALVINDHWEVATELGAPHCHLGQEDFFGAGHRHAAELPPSARRPVGLGLSTHAPDQAQRALAAAPAYVAIGPVFATATKPQAQPVTLDYVRWAAAHVTLPWFAIGGITLGNLDQLLAAGARRVAVVSAILEAADLARACQQFKERLR